MERRCRARLAEAIFEDGPTPRLFLRLGSNRRAAVVLGAAAEPRPRGTEGDFGARCLRGGRRVWMGERGETQLDDLFGAVTDLTLNTQTHECDALQSDSGAREQI